MDIYPKKMKTLIRKDKRRNKYNIVKQLNIKN